MSLLRLQRRTVAVPILMVLMALCVSVDCHAVGPKDTGLHAKPGVVFSVTENSDHPCCPVDGHNHTESTTALLASTVPAMPF